MGISSVTTGSAVRALVWTGLACCLLGYAVTRTQKYARSLVAISAAEEPAAEFLFPAVSVCRPLGAGEEVEELLAAPLIKDVLYKVLAENGTRCMGLELARNSEREGRISRSGLNNRDYVCTRYILYIQSNFGTMVRKLIILWYF